jgi:hypothetical protein
MTPLLLQNMMIQRPLIAFVRSHMLQEVIARFDSRPGFTILVLRGLALLNYQDQIVLRFKKVDGEGRHQNYQTKQQKDFDDQLELPEIPPAATIRRIIVSRPWGKSMMWSSQVNVVDKEAMWEDITPARLAGTSRLDRRRRGAGDRRTFQR